MKIKYIIFKLIINLVQVAELLLFIYILLLTKKTFFDFVHPSLVFFFFFWSFNFATVTINTKKRFFDFVHPSVDLFSFDLLISQQLQ